MTDHHNEHKAFLAKLEERSREKQEQFMNNIASRLGHPRMYEAPTQTYRGAPDFWQEKRWLLDEQIERFTANFISVGAHVERCLTKEEASNFIAGKAKEMSAARIIRQDEAELAQLKLEDRLPDARIGVWNSDDEHYWKAEAAGADFGIVQADHAVAYTGSVVVTSSKVKGRSVSLLPTVLFIIIPTNRFVTTLGEVLVPFDKAGREQLPAGIHFISGPSRSSDIENDLTIGVHGPGIVYALIVDAV